MNLTLINDTSYNYTLKINNKEYEFDRKKAVTIDYNDNDKISLISNNKSSVHLNILDIILGVFLGDSTITNLYCNYDFSIHSKDNNNVTITISYNDWNPREQLKLSACYAKSENVLITKEKYSISKLDKVRKKHKRLHLFVTSLFPVALIELILCFFLSPPILPILLLFIWAFVFGVPSIKEIKRFNEAVDEELVNNKLSEYASNRRAGSTDYDETTSKSGKLIEKALNKMFKFNEDKK